MSSIRGAPERSHRGGRRSSPIHERRSPWDRACGAAAERSGPVQRLPDDLGWVPVQTSWKSRRRCAWQAPRGRALAQGRRVRRASSSRSRRRPRGYPRTASGAPSVAARREEAGDPGRCTADHRGDRSHTRPFFTPLPIPSTRRDGSRIRIRVSSPCRRSETMRLAPIRSTSGARYAHALAAPAGRRGAGDVGSHVGQDLVSAA